MRAARKLFTLAAGIVLVTTATAAPAAADPPTSSPWTLAGCVEGSLSPEVVYNAEVNFLVVAGTATQCEPTASTTSPTGFAIAWWGDGWGGSIDDWAIRIFPAPGATVPFGVGTLRNIPGRYYVCLVQAAPRPAGTPSYVPYTASPVTCMAVTIVQPDVGDPIATTTPLPVDAPQVSRAARKPSTYTGSVVPIDDTGEQDGGGNCGTCY